MRMIYDQNLKSQKKFDEKNFFTHFFSKVVPFWKLLVTLH